VSAAPSRNRLTWALLLVALSGAWWLAFEAGRATRRAVDRRRIEAEPRLQLEPGAGAVPPALLPAVPGARGSDARSAPAPAPGLPPPAHVLEAGEALDAPTLPAVAPEDLGLEALARATVDLWAQEEFDALTSEERRALLPIDDTLPVAPGRLSAMFGRPTHEEVARAARAPEVLEAQRVFEQLDLALAELQGAPRARRAAGFERTLEALRRARDVAYLDLARACDRLGGFRDWETLARLYLAWSARGAGPWREPPGATPAGGGDRDP